MELLKKAQNLIDNSTITESKEKLQELVSSIKENLKTSEKLSRIQLIHENEIKKTRGELRRENEEFSALLEKNDSLQKELANKESLQMATKKQFESEKSAFQKELSLIERSIDKIDRSQKTALTKLDAEEQVEVSKIKASFQMKRDDLRIKLSKDTEYSDLLKKSVSLRESISEISEDKTPIIIDEEFNVKNTRDEIEKSNTEIQEFLNDYSNDNVFYKELITKGDTLQQAKYDLNEICQAMSSELSKAIEGLEIKAIKSGKSTDIRISNILSKIDERKEQDIYDNDIKVKKQTIN